MVHYIYEFSREFVLHNSTFQESNSTTRNFNSSSPLQEPNPRGWDIVKQKYLNKGLDDNTVTILLNSWRKGTKKQLNPLYRRLATIF